MLFNLPPVPTNIEADFIGQILHLVLCGVLRNPANGMAQVFVGWLEVLENFSPDFLIFRRKASHRWRIMGFNLLLSGTDQFSKIAKPETSCWSGGWIMLCYTAYLLPYSIIMLPNSVRRFSAGVPMGSDRYLRTVNSSSYMASATLFSGKPWSRSPSMS